MLWRVSKSYQEGKSSAQRLTSTSTITDDDYVHALRVYKDTVTGAVRLQSSIHLGDLNQYVNCRLNELNIEWLVTINAVRPSGLRLSLTTSGNAVGLSRTIRKR